MQVVSQTMISGDKSHSSMNGVTSFTEQKRNYSGHWLSIAVRHTATK